MQSNLLIGFMVFQSPQTVCLSEARHLHYISIEWSLCWKSIDQQKIHFAFHSQFLQYIVCRTAIYILASFDRSVGMQITRQLKAELMLRKERKEESCEWVAQWEHWALLHSTWPVEQTSSYISSNSQRHMNEWIAFFTIMSSYFSCNRRLRNKRAL